MITKYKNFNIKGGDITPQKIWIERREVLKMMGIIGIGMSTFDISSNANTKNIRRSNKNLLYKVSREITEEKFATTYNNFYEFGSSKNIWRSAQKLSVDPWLIKIDGMGKNPIEIDIREVLPKVGGIEERIYRHRCVEAWAMTIPWEGFELSKLLRLCEPTTEAKYLRMETFFDDNIARGQKQSWYPWPYVEGITIEEAYNQLSFIATGIYGKELPKQNGAPLRLLLPWKYGFKSIKSIKRFTLTDQQPKSFWEYLQPKEYGFWANVNPNVPHPRWSQKTEKLIGEEIKIVPTQLFNGYSEYVSHLYPKLSKETVRYYF